MLTILSIVCFIELILLYFLSRLSITKLFIFLRRLFRYDTLVYSIISFIFFPGTLIHELSHFVMAVLLMLKVRDITVFPNWDGKMLKLGAVMYEKKDVVRGILVGIAPLIVGIVILWWMFSLDLLTSSNSLLRILSVIFIFILTTSMFSSKQDLVDIIYVVPIIVIVFGIIYIFQIDLQFLITPQIIEVLEDFLYAVASYLGISIVIHALMIVIMNLLLFLTRK